MRCRAALLGLAMVISLAASAQSPLEPRLAQARDFFGSRDYPKAIAAFETLIRDAERARERGVLARALFYKGRSHYFLADYRAALPPMQRALVLSREDGDRPFAAETLRGICRLHKQQGTYAEGLRACDESIAIYDALGEKREAGRSWITIGAIRDLSGEYQQALAAYERARVALESVRDDEYYTLFNEIGITYTNLGRYEEALAAHRISLEGREKSGDKYMIGVSHSNLGDVYFNYGQYERAIEHYLLCLQMCGFAGERRTLVVTLQQLSRTAMAMGEARKSLDYAQRGRALARELGIEPLEAVALRQMGDAHGALGEPGASRGFHVESLALARKTEARADEAASNLALAGLDLANGDARSAQLRAADALRLALANRAPDLEIEARVALARVARIRGARDVALAELRKAVAIVDDVRGGVHTDSGKIGYLDTRQSAFELLALTLDEQGNAAAALEVAEAGRGRAFSDLLAAQRVALRAADAGTFDEIRALESRLRALPDEPADAAQRAELLATRAGGESALGGRLRALRNEQPELASMLAAEQLGARDIVAVAGRLRATMVEYLVTDQRLLIWVVSPDGVITSRAVDLPRDRLRASVRQLQQHMNQLTATQLSGDAGLRTQLEALHGWLLEPIGSLLPDDRDALVYVIPHDALHLVPFVALRDARGRYAIERHTFAYAPAVAVLRYTEPKKAQVVSAARPHFLGLADPTPPKDVAERALPGARDEVRSAGNRFAAERRLTLTGDKASESNLKRLAAAQTVLHLAVHGLVRDDRPWETALILAPGEGEDGWLRIAEIFGLDLNADLVILSGCSTGLGKISGDGIVGLSRAMIYAGTPSVVVSQWDVSDRSTAYLMDRFYAARASGRGKAAALRAAQLDTLARHPHPVLWAPFVLIGEP